MDCQTIHRNAQSPESEWSQARATVKLRAEPSLLMAELKQLSPDILVHIAQTLGITLKALVATIELLDEGGTVPFIARYRKEATGNLDEVQIRGAEEKLAYFRELEDRRETVLRTIEEQGKLTDELRERILGTLDR